MPGLDQTGPMGQGAQTGRKQGRCNSAENAEQVMNFGRRGGRGFRFRNQSSDETVITNSGRGNRRGRGMGFGRMKK
ncbi:DUF5320 domain-containing protein [uncultured Draconibacterium sp.]|uniref:DUF5320 domain-containing protein n=1 Tax=uncultured Draconibacterium sp. TaxID=1573823 RepID=UPI0025E4443B|nr:DUF5320 domain-containing protein [uncultured Draconibacterium sp.]